MNLHLPGHILGCLFIIYPCLGSLCEKYTCDGLHRQWRIQNMLQLLKLHILLMSTATLTSERRVFDNSFSLISAKGKAPRTWMKYPSLMWNQNLMETKWLPRSLELTSVINRSNSLLEHTYPPTVQIRRRRHWNHCKRRSIWRFSILENLPCLASTWYSKSGRNGRQSKHHWEYTYSAPNRMRKGCCILGVLRSS